MYSNTVRIVLIAIGALAAIFFASVGLWLQMGASIAFILLIVLGYFLNGAVFLALRKMAKNDFEGAEKLLQMTRYPQYLGRTQKAYYYFLQGCIEANKEHLQPAARNLEQALQLGLRVDNDKTVALLNLSSIYLSLGDKNKAAKYLEAVKKLRYNPALQPEIDHLSEVLQ
jgi:tetratricopeptide (TPR) repeat protein